MLIFLYFGVCKITFYITNISVNRMQCNQPVCEQFQALQTEPGRKNTNIDFNQMKMNELKKLGRLLSVILEQKLIKKGDIATKAGVLKLIKDCSFFPYYIKFLCKYT